MMEYISKNTNLYHSLKNMLEVDYYLQDMEEFDSKDLEMLSEISKYDQEMEEMEEDGNW